MTDHLTPVPDPPPERPNLLVAFTMLAVMVTFGFVWADVLLGGVSSPAYVAQVATVAGIMLLGVLADKVQRHG